MRSHGLAGGPSIMECGKVRLVMFRGSSILPVAVVEVEYTVAVILHILQVDRDNDKGTGQTADSLTVACVSGSQADKPCDVSGISSFTVAVEYTLVVILYILWVGRDSKRTRYAADSLAITHVSGGS
jgi:hypothetical protein